MTCRAGAEAGPLVGLDREIRAREIVLAGGQNPALAVGYNSLPQPLSGSRIVEAA